MTGNNLGILIHCDQTPSHRWMSFASWYSINTHLPDAMVAVCLLRGIPIIDFVNWPNKCHTPFFQYPSDVDPLTIVDFGDREKLLLSPAVMAVRSYEGDTTITKAQEETLTTFIDYSEGCGRFVTTDWIDKIEAPFQRAMDRFGNPDLNANEIAIFKLWDRMNRLYSAL